MGTISSYHHNQVSGAKFDCKIFPQILICNSIPDKSKTVESEVFLVATLTARLHPPFLLPVINSWLADPPANGLVKPPN